MLEFAPQSPVKQRGPSVLNYLLIYCRAGFESEAASEISTRAAELGFFGYPKFSPNSAYVLFHLTGEQNALELMAQLKFRRLIFARQWVACTDLLSHVSTKDRITPLLAAAEGLPQSAELYVETADTTDGRNLNGFARKFGSALSGAMRQAGLMLPRKQRADWRTHLFVIDGQTFWLGVSPIKNSCRWEQGILRLKFPPSAPSRSTLKLEEAWHWFVPKADWQDKIESGRTAVDLGAAPGGWTWQLVNRNMFVTAVDNGPMSQELMDSGQVDHRREDAFTFKPNKPVDMLVCDVVEKPSQVTELMAKWAINRWSTILIFNLKLPMKQRFAEVESCLEQLQSILTEAQLRYKLEAKHLYHDREEITVYLELSR
jgi:23S rRNA (cytidine2498-2'-O)-methyltransferase